MEEKYFYYTALPEEPPEQDYQLAQGILKIPNPRSDFHSKKIQYHQGQSSCTVYGNIGALSDLVGVKFERAEIEGLWSQAKKLGASDALGWYISSANDLVRKFWNQKNPNDQVMTFRLRFNSEEFFHVLDQGYTVVVSFAGNGAYWKDKDDGVLDGVDFGVSTFGHIVRITKDNDQYELVIDNYAGDQDANIYKIQRSHFTALLKNNIFRPFGYIFVFTNDFEHMNDEQTVPLWAVASVEKAKKSGLINDQTDLFKTTKIKEGDMPLYRALVIIDRLNLLN